MAQQTIKGYAYHVDYGWGDPAEYRIYTSADQSDDNYTLIGPVEVQIEVPDDFDPRPAKIAALEAKKQEIRAKFAAAMTEIERKISELQAITCEVA